ncbi:polysaccharide deacetylase family protein [Blastococcus sp. CT_GayMR19]|uniref:polysaccharide deacetylase family protein n=1 Tax=Blastococcus sp. CT_GayMR19 TaxID=2559608 RepID=UPI0010735EC5|nr:polysaccharide deacetylase family protein [Blastococcus sp. CT_GayMR19]TFV73016.1 polysaccharide deacetylase family protein [Blastococcus sp. CT_GayMR19]
MNRRRHDPCLRVLIAGLLVGAFSITAPAAQAVPPPSGGGEPSAASSSGASWRSSPVLAADPATVPVPDAVPTAEGVCPSVGYGVRYVAPGEGKTVALTFDDGPGRSTEAIMDILEDAEVTATFFNVGVNEAVRPEIVRAQASRGFLLGNHTWTHPDMATLSETAQAREMDDAIAGQTSLVGAPPCDFRPPYGSYDETTLSLAQARGMNVWNWSVDTEDWKARGSDDPFWVDRIVDLAKAGGSQTNPVVLMHNMPAGSPATVAALPAIIDFYRDRGYTFVDLAGRVAGQPDVEEPVPPDAEEPVPPDADEPRSDGPPHRWPTWPPHTAATAAAGQGDTTLHGVP